MGPLAHDPKKLQTFRTRSCAKSKRIASVVGSTLSKNGPPVWKVGRAGRCAFGRGHGHHRGCADTLGHRRRGALAEPARLADDLDGNEIRDLSAKIDWRTVDRNVADRESLRGGHFED